MILYLDTSAFIKLYANEPGADLVGAAAAESLCVGHGAELVCFASFDVHLNQAAADLGLSLLASV